MTPVLSPNTQAILLLTAPLIAGRDAMPADLLSPGEYKHLARHLREIQHQPADLLLPNAAELLRACHPVIDEQRLQKLLGRGFLLSQVIERWQARAIWVISRADADYPRRLKARLREDAPAVLYGCGNRTLLETGGLAVVGSRHVHDDLIDYTLAVSQLAARAGKSLISGGARGIDQAAMRGALEGGGKVCGVLADSLEKTSMNRELRKPLIDGQLVLISPYDPLAGFNVGHAMQRNKLIYALADTSLVVSSDLNKGGTWAGAIEQLDQLKLVPVFIRSTGTPSAGLAGLQKKGALPWPNPQNVDSFEAVFTRATPTASPQANLALFPSQETATLNTTPTTPAPLDATPQAESTPPVTAREEAPTVTSETAQADLTPAEILFSAARTAIEHLLTAPMKEAEVAAALNMSKTQTKAWLQRLVDEGVIEKQKKPAGYIAKPSGLFERQNT